MMRRFDQASRDVLKRLVNGPLGDGEPHALARSLASLFPSEAGSRQDPQVEAPATNIVRHLDKSEPASDSPGHPEQEHPPKATGNEAGLS